MPYTTFLKHTSRDFADSLTATICHDEGDALLGTVNSPTEFFQTVAATDPGRYDFRRHIRLVLDKKRDFHCASNKVPTIHAMRVLGCQEGASIIWNAVSGVCSMKVYIAVVREDAQLVPTDPYKIFVSWYGDQYGTMERRHGDVEGHYGACTSVSLDFRSSTVRRLFYLPPGAASAPLIAAVVKDLCHASKTRISVYAAFTGRNALVHIYPAAGIFDSPMAAKLSNTIGATGVEHCASCDIVGLKTTSERKERAMSSTTVFDVGDARYARVQERIVPVQHAVIGACLSSEATINASLLLNGMQKGPGDQFMGLSEAHGAGSFDVREHVKVAPSHLVFFNLADPLL